MIFRTVDLETTGLPSEDNDGPPTGLMEVAYLDYVPGMTIGMPQASLVNCGIPVSIEARAVHHISDQMVQGAMSPTEACALLAGGKHEYLVAHNVDHEQCYIGAGVRHDTEEERQWLCTYKTSLRIWPDAPGHKLHELRYFLNLDAEPDFDERFAMLPHPHRAAPDAYVTAHLLRRILAFTETDQAKADKVDVARLVKWSSGPALLVMCWMKKHKGKTWRQVAYDDRPYLQWIYEKSDVKDRDILATAKYWLKKTASTGPHPAGDPYSN